VPLFAIEVRRNEYARVRRPISLALKCRPSAAHWPRMEGPDQEAHCEGQTLPPALRPRRVDAQGPHASTQALEAFVKIVGQRLEVST